MKFLMVVIISVLTFWGMAGDPEYIGTKKCKSCHDDDETGNQYKVWEDNKHSKAFELLKTAEAEKLAKAAGLKNKASEEAACLQCHTVGFGKGGYEVKDEAFWNPADDDRKGKKEAKRMENLKNVGCESCHGPGSEYKSKKMMQAIFDGTEKGEDHGLTTITEKACVTCHNPKSPTYKEFHFEEAMKQIGHPYPEGFKKGK